MCEDRQKCWSAVRRRFDSVTASDLKPCGAQNYNTVRVKVCMAKTFLKLVYQANNKCRVRSRSVGCNIYFERRAKLGLFYGYKTSSNSDVVDFKIYAYAADQTLCEVRPPSITLSISEKREAGVRAASRLSQPPPPLTFRNLRRSHGHRGQSSLDYVTEATYRPRMHSRRTVTDPEIILRWVDNARVS